MNKSPMLIKINHSEKDLLTGIGVISTLPSNTNTSVAKNSERGIGSRTLTDQHLGIPGLCTILTSVDGHVDSLASGVGVGKIKSALGDERGKESPTFSSEQTEPWQLGSGMISAGMLV